MNNIEEQIDNVLRNIDIYNIDLNNYEIINKISQELNKLSISYLIHFIDGNLIIKYSLNPRGGGDVKSYIPLQVKRDIKLGKILE